MAIFSWRERSFKLTAISEQAAGFVRLDISSNLTPTMEINRILTAGVPYQGHVLDSACDDLIIFNALVARNLFSIGSHKARLLDTPP
jgi:hypothetical protein